MRRSALENANLALAFLLELGVLAALLIWGWSTGSNLLTKIGLGVGAAAIAVIVWALFGAPRSTRRLKGMWYWLLRVAFDAVGALAFYAAGQHAVAAVFAVVALLNCVLGYIWKQ